MRPLIRHDLDSPLAQHLQDTAIILQIAACELDDGEVENFLDHLYKAAEGVNLTLKCITQAAEELREEMNGA